MDNKARGAKTITVDGKDYEVFFNIQDAIELEKRLNGGSLFSALGQEISLSDSMAMIEVGTKGKLKLERLPSNFADIILIVVAALGYALGQDIDVPEDMQGKKTKPKRKKA